MKSLMHCLIVLIWLQANFSLLANTTDESSDADSKVLPIDIQVQGGSDGNFDYAASQFWLPPGAGPFRGILCLVIHPLQLGGARLANPTPWVELAAKRRCALMAVSFVETGHFEGKWCKAEQGSGSALLAAIDAAARDSGHLELKGLPIVMAGVCAAGQFAYHFAAVYPERTSAFVTIGGGKHDLTRVGGAASVPALLNTAPDRGAIGVDNLVALSKAGGALGAPWRLTVDSIDSYDKGSCSRGVLNYLETALENIHLDRTALVKQLADQPLAMGVRDDFSLCGVKLPSYGSLLPTTLDLGRINVSGSRSIPVSFRVLLDHNGAEEAFVPEAAEVVDRKVNPLDPGTLAVACALDLSALPLGAFHYRIPVCYRRQGKVMLGGSMLDVTGTLEGEILATPRTLYLTIPPGGVMEPKTIRVASKDQQPVEILGCTADNDNLEIVSSPCADGSAEVSVKLRPPAARTAFAGSILLEVRTAKIRRDLKIFCLVSGADQSLASGQVHDGKE